MTEIGNSLREARIRRGLSIKDVEDRTKVRGKYLEALENDDFEVLPGPVYVKAFLRTYATFLKLDADALVAEYRSDLPLRARAIALGHSGSHEDAQGTDHDRARSLVLVRRR